MSKFLNHPGLSSTCLLMVILLLTLGTLYSQPVSAEANTPATSTVAFDLMKKFSGPVPDGYKANQFSFNISTITGPINLVAFTDDSADTVVNLPVGTYTISENGPAGFIPADWTVQWSGAGCDNQTDLSTIITVTEDDLGLGNFGCTADNQWKPKNNGGGGEATSTTGILLVSKVIVGTTTVPASNFSFTYTGAVGNIVFEQDGTNALTLATGTYSVTEVVSVVYTTSYSNCSNIVVVAGAITTACVITNTLNASTTDGGGGGGGTATGTIIIEKQTIPDGNLTQFTFNPSWSTQDFILRDGQQSTSTALATGTYSIVESLNALWSQTSAVCSDGSPITAIGLAAGETVTCVFTNTMNTNSGGGGNNNSNSNGNGSSGGRSNRPNDTAGQGGGSMNNSTPMPLVLGVNANALPVGAPNTGAGGTAAVNVTLPTIVAILPTGTRKRK